MREDYAHLSNGYGGGHDPVRLSALCRLLLPCSEGFTRRRAALAMRSEYALRITFRNQCLQWLYRLRSPVQGAIYRQPLPGEPGYSYQSAPDGGLGFEDSRPGPDAFRMNDHPEQPLEVQMKGPPFMQQQQPQMHGQQLHSLNGGTAGYQPGAVPAGGSPPGYSVAASNQSPQQQPPVGYMNGVQSYPHQPADNGDRLGNGEGLVKESQPVPGTTLHTTGGDEEVVASPAANGEAVPHGAATRR